MNQKTALRTLAASLAFLAGAATAAWPEKPVKILVPFPAGGASDATARALGQTLAKRLGQPVVIENRPGASGAIAAQAALASPPDGYTILWASSGMVSLPFIQLKPPYKTMTELAPVATVARLPFCAFVHPSVPAKTLGEFRAEAKRNPGKLSFASGSLSEYLAATKLDAATGAKMQVVPYKGGAQLMPDLVAGRVQVNIGPCSTGMPFVTTGKLRVLATVLDNRSPLLPDVPTAKEAGMPELAVSTWQALLAPPRTPKEITDRLAKETALALKDAETVAQFARIGVEASYRDAAGLETLVREDAIVWERFVRENGIERE